MKAIQLLKPIAIMLMVWCVSSLSYSQIINKDGLKLNVQNPKNNAAIEQLNNDPLTIDEVARTYFYLIELSKCRSDFAIADKQITYQQQQLNAYENQLELKSDMIKNLEAYAEQVKPKWYQSEFAILAWVAGSIALTYLVVK